MTGAFPSAGWLVFARACAEFAGAVLAPARLLLHLAFFRRAERARVRRALASPAPPPPAAPPRPGTPRAGPPLTLFLSAGEASGELHARHFVEELRARRANLRVVAFGGESLRAAGAEVLLPLGAGAGMGLLHGLAAVPHHARIATRFVEALDRERPAACVFVDNPGFHLVLASLARARGVPAIQYVCPQTWAWAPWRWRRMRRDLAAALAIAPFEVPYFSGRGIPVRYVGHPLGDALAASAPSKEPPIAGEGPLVVLFPGSRRAEVERHTPTLLRIARTIAKEIPAARFAMALRDPRRAEQARAIAARADPSSPAAIVEGDPDRWLRGAALAIAKSGTGTLEIAHRRVPLVILYRLARAFDRAAARALLTVSHFSFLNLLAGGREIVPEFLYVREEEEGAIAAQALRLLRDEGARRDQLDAVARILPYLESTGANARAAEAALAIAEASLTRSPTARA